MRALKVRVAIHAAILATLALAGYFAFSRLIFPQVFRTEGPVAPLLGMASGILIAAGPASAGIGFGIILDALRGVEITAARAMELVYLSQYLTAAFVLIALHYSVVA